MDKKKSAWKVTPAQMGAVLASRTLPGDAKVLWEKQVYMDQGPEGCRMGAAMMGQILGRSADYIEVLRRRLVNVGLLYRTGSARTSSWYVSFPLDLRLPVKPKAEEYAEAARRLDAHIEECGGWDSPSIHRQSEREKGSSLAVDQTPKSGVSSPASVREGGFRGVAPLSQSLVRDSLYPGSQGRGESFQDSGTAREGTEIPAMRAALRELDARLTAGNPGGERPEIVA